MILRQLISTFLACAMCSTSIHAYVPKNLNTAVFLMNEKRELRCRFTPRTAKHFSLEQLQGLIQNNALAVATDASLVNELRPCNENDVTYAQIVFDDSMALTGTPSFPTVALVIYWAILSGSLIGDYAARKNNSEPYRGDVDICGEEGFVFYRGECLSFESLRKELPQNGGITLDTANIFNDFLDVVTQNCKENSALILEDGFQCRPTEGMEPAPFKGKMLFAGLDKIALLKILKSRCEEEESLIVKDRNLQCVPAIE